MATTSRIPAPAHRAPRVRHVSGPPLVLSQVRKTLAGQPVLHDVSFRCRAGAVTALLGPNGAGKTTSVAIATGLRRPDAGQVRVFGRAVTERGARRRLSLVPQDIGLPAAVSVRGCLRFVADQRPPSGYAAPSEEICARLGVTALLDRRAGGLSGGEQRRVAVVLGLVRVPGLLILDEATTNLDETARATTWQLVREYAARGGAALVTSHILADVEAHADFVVALTEGRVVADAPLPELRARLGGSTVSVRVPAAAAADVREAIRGRCPQAGTAGDPVLESGRALLRWRAGNPLPLVAALAEVAPDAVDLQVRPIPLAEVLHDLSAGRT